MLGNIYVAEVRGKLVRTGLNWPEMAWGSWGRYIRNLCVAEVRRAVT